MIKIEANEKDHEDKDPNEFGQVPLQLILDLPIKIFILAWKASLS